MKRALSILALCALTACGGGGESPFNPSSVASEAKPAVQHVKLSQDPVRCDVTLYGDSIMAGVYMDDHGSGQQHWRRPAVEINLHRPKYRVVDESRPGQSLYAFMWDIANRPRDTKFVVVESGVIDSWVAVPVGQRLLDVIDFLKAEGRTPILTGYARQTVRDGKWAWLTADQLAFHNEWNEAVRYVAQQTGVEFADWGSVPMYGGTDIIDAVHPTEAYSQRLSAALIAAMDRAAPECK